MLIKNVVSVLCVMAVSGCASSAERFGAMATPSAESGIRSFYMPQNDMAAQAVRRALLDLGYEDRNDGAFRVDVGFAVRERQISVSHIDKTGRAEIVSPDGEVRLNLCDAQSYVLTVALVERSSGRITTRSGATMSRCHAPSSEILPVLARTALEGEA